MRLSYLVLVLTIALSLFAMGCGKGIAALENASNAKCKQAYPIELDQSACTMGVAKFVERTEIAKLMSKVTPFEHDGNSYLVVSFNELYSYIQEREKSCEAFVAKDNVAALMACKRGIWFTFDTLTEIGESKQSVSLYTTNAVRVVGIEKTYVQKFQDQTKAPSKKLEVEQVDPTLIQELDNNK